MGENRRKQKGTIKVRQVPRGTRLVHVVVEDNPKNHSGIILPTSEEKPIVAKIAYKKPHSTTVLEKVKIHNQKTGLVNMSIDNMLSASHALSICQNGRKLDLKSYPTSVRNYVARVIKAGNVDGSLKQLNEQIVLKIGTEASQ